MDQKYYYTPNRTLFRPIPNMRTRHPDMNFGGKHQFSTRGAPVLVTDPIYLADIYNMNDDPLAEYVRANGVVVCGFGGDTSCPVCWKSPLLMLPTATHIEWDMCPGQLCWPDGSVAIIGCDSASFVFLVLHGQMPSLMREKCETVAQERNGLIMHLQDGTYDVWLEQLPGFPHANMAGLYRNIVAERVLE